MKQNSALYCDIPNRKEVDQQLDISPSKHVITTYAKGVITNKNMRQFGVAHEI